MSIWSQPITFRFQIIGNYNHTKFFCSCLEQLKRKDYEISAYVYIFQILKLFGPT
jgi:hypothetical protein